jgi:hypothetical protein
LRVTTARSKIVPREVFTQVAAVEKAQRIEENLQPIRGAAAFVT